MRFGLNEDTLNTISEIFEANSKVDKAIVFGSRAKGNYRPDSDIDIAVKGFDLTLDDILKMQVAFEEKRIKYKIDVVDYHTIKEKALTEHIDRVGIEMYSRWKESKLGEICTDINYGYTASATDNPIGPKFLRITDIVPQRVNWETVPFCEINEKDHEKYKLEKGDIVIARTGATTGYNYTFKDDVDAVFASYLIRYRIDKKRANPFFIEYVLKSDHWKGFVEGIIGGSAQPGANAKMFAEFNLFLPPINEQTAISELLSSLEKKIDLLHRQNKTLEQLAETLFRQWFVEGAEESWEKRSLDNIAEFLNGLACQKFPPQNNEVGLPVIKIKEMKNGITESSDFATSNVPQKYIVQNGDLLFSWSGSLDVVLWFGGNGVLNQHLFKVTSHEFPQWFCYFWIKYHLEEFKGIAEDKSTTMGHIQRHHLSQAKVLIPNNEDLKNMNEVISPVFQKLKLNQIQIQTLTKLRDALLPKLLNGEVRVELS